MKLVFCGTGWLPVVDAIAARLPAGASIHMRDPARPLAAQLVDADVILPSNCPIDAAAIAAPRRLVLIQQPAAGYERIDVAAARARGVPVCNAPGVNANAVAELVVLLILGLARRIPAARRAFASATIGEPVGVEIAGKTLGLIGEGRTGGRVRAAAAALGMEVIAVRSTSPPGALEDLLARADFVSIHVPLTAATRGLFDARRLAAMKPGAFLINCARGGIVDRAALLHALESGHLGGAGLDVHWEEPWDPADPLYSRPDVLALPHIAGSTDVAFTRIAEIVAENVRRVSRGEPVLHEVGV